MKKEREIQDAVWDVAVLQERDPRSGNLPARRNSVHGLVDRGCGLRNEKKGQRENKRIIRAKK